MKSGRLHLDRILELGQRKMAKTKPDPWPSFDHHCRNIERSLNYKVESNFSCLQGLPAFFAHDGGNLSKDLNSAHLSDVDRDYEQLAQWQAE